MHRVALVGQSRTVEARIRALERVSDVEITAISLSDGDPVTLAAEYGLDASTASDPRALVERVTPAIVDICSESALDPTFVEYLAEHDCSLLSTFPVTKPLEELTDIAAAIKESGLNYMPINSLRFVPAYAEGARVTQAGDIGSPGVARITRTGRLESTSNTGQTESVFRELLARDFDYIRWLFGPVKHVFARGIDSDDQAPGQGVVTLRFEDGPIAHLVGRYDHLGTSDVTGSMEIAGDRGLIEHDGLTPASLRIDRADGTSAREPVRPDRLQREYDHFVQRLEQGASPRIGHNDLVEASRIARAAIESFRGHRPISPREVVA